MHIINDNIKRCDGNIFPPIMRRMTGLVPRNVGCEAPCLSCRPAPALTAVPMPTKNKNSRFISIFCFIFLARLRVTGRWWCRYS